MDEEELTLKDFSSKWIDSVKMEFYDELTGLELDLSRVRAARRAEMEFMAQLNVWSYSTVTQLTRIQGERRLAAAGLTASKVTQPDRTTGRPRDQSDEHDRSRRRRCSLRSDTAVGMLLRVLDISRAHPHCEIKRLLYVRLPLEDPRSQEPGVCGVLNMALYGTRDAGQNFELTTMDTLTQAGAMQGICTPCVHKWIEKKVCLFHYGDDFIIAGPRSGGDAVLEALRVLWAQGQAT